jgi:hypothetical protein
MRHLLGRAIPLALVDISEDTESAGARRYPGRNVRYVKGPAPAVGDMMDSELALFGPCTYAYCRCGKPLVLLS